MLYHFQNTNLSEIEFGKYLHEIVEGAIRHNLSVPPNYTMFFKALMTVEGIGKKVSPDLDLIAECKPYVESLVAERYGPERLMREFSRTSVELAGIIHRLPASLSALMRMLDGGKLPVVIESPQAEEDRQAAERRTNRMMVVCAGVGLILSSSVIYGNQTDPQWSVLTSLMLILGLGLSLSTVIKILFSRNW
jgi:ubiquinone biosynthesis protein